MTGWHRHRHRPGPGNPADTAKRGMGTFNWPPAGTCTRPHTGTFSWPCTPSLPRRSVLSRSFLSGQDRRSRDYMAAIRKQGQTRSAKTKCPRFQEPRTPCHGMSSGAASESIRQSARQAMSYTPAPHRPFTKEAPVTGCAGRRSRRSKPPAFPSACAAGPINSSCRARVRGRRPARNSPYTLARDSTRRP